MSGVVFIGLISTWKVAKMSYVLQSAYLRCMACTPQALKCNFGMHRAH